MTNECMCSYHITRKSDTRNSFIWTCTQIVNYALKSEVLTVLHLQLFFCLLCIVSNSTSIYKNFSQWIQVTQEKNMTKPGKPYHTIANQLCIVSKKNWNTKEDKSKFMICDQACENRACGHKLHPTTLQVITQQWSKIFAFCCIANLWA